MLLPAVAEKAFTIVQWFEVGELELKRGRQVLAGRSGYRWCLRTSEKSVTRPRQVNFIKGVQFG